MHHGRVVERGETGDVLDAPQEAYTRLLRDSVPRAGTNFTEGMKFSRARRAEEAVPGVGTEAHDAGKIVFQGTKTDGTQKRGEISAEGEY